MVSIQTKTLQDLQFETVLQTISDVCVTDLGKEQVLSIIPFRESEELKENLARTTEFVSSFENSNPIPNHGFESITRELKMLHIENSVLDLASFRRIVSVADTSIQLIRFFEKNHEYYPFLQMYSSELPVVKEIGLYINAVIDRFGEIKDDASPELQHIRRRLKGIVGKINQSFSSALSTYGGLGYLDEIKETVVENKRVLAVSAMYRKKVKGLYLGSSKTGSIAYIEPEQTLQFTRELSDLTYEEKEEILKILTVLTEVIRPHTEVLQSYQSYLGQIDVLCAKARYAKKINGVLPTIVTERKIYYRDAFHPILWLSNTLKKQVTYSQTLQLEADSRIIVISGPNAGGKSITLKTLGLLQLMLQSGILIPVHPSSETCLFDRILTDIGDNQSIENHLSTYSYRLKNMNYFLKKCSSKTLFLIDEFGTGSDPELGGALAETFLEEFYHREAFGIITTHYSNLKILANELPYTVNANMLFDEKTLLPLFRLHIGQAGSSFTFEVAQKNGIPFGLINRAKKKIEKGKVRFDKTIASLQKEQSKLEKTSQNLKEEEKKSREENQKLEVTNVKIKQKLESYQELYDANQRLIYMGQKVDDLSKKYFNSKNKKEMVSDFLKMVEIENSKRKKVEAKEVKLEQIKQKEIIKEVEVQVAEIRKEKKEKKVKQSIVEKTTRIIPKIGDRVRMKDGKAIGDLESIEKDKATVNYGVFVSKCSINDLEVVQAKKK